MACTTPQTFKRRPTNQRPIRVQTRLDIVYALGDLGQEDGGAPVLKL